MKDSFLFALAKIIIPIVIILVGTSYSSYFIKDMHTLFWIKFISPIVVIIFGAFGVLKLQKIMRNKVMGTSVNERIMRNGVPSTATILDISDTGNRIDRIYILVNITLRIYETREFESFEKNLIVPLSPVKIPQFTPGSTVKVFVDPATLDVAINESIK